MTTKMTIPGSPLVFDENDELVGVVTPNGRVRLFALVLPYDVNPVSGSRAAVTLAQDGDDLIDLTAVEYGGAGNSVTIALVDPGEASQALTVIGEGNNITVSLATGSNSALTSTVADVIEAINASTNASALVVASLHDGADDSVVLDAATAAPLEGGVGVTEGPIGCLCFDENVNMYRKTAAQIWVSATGSGQQPI